MLPAEKCCIRFREAGCRWTLGLLLACSLGFFCVPAHAQSDSVITNLAQLTRNLPPDQPLVREADLEVTVVECDTNTGTMVVQDATGAELLEIADLPHEFKPGDRIQIRSPKCFFQLIEDGVYVSAAPALDNDGTHPARTVSGEFDLAAGRYPLRVDWFNQTSDFQLFVSCVATNLDEGAAVNQFRVANNLLHVTRAEYYEGYFRKLPNFQILNPVRMVTTTNFDLGIRSRDDYIGIRFEGYFVAPQAGRYFLNLRSDDGSRMWLGNPAVSVEKVGMVQVPAIPAAMIGEQMSGLGERKLAAVEGRVDFISRLGKGLRMELRSDRNSVSVWIANAETLDPGDLLNAQVRVSGVAAGILAGDEQTVLGRVVTAGIHNLKILENPPGKGKPPALLTTALQIHSLTTNDVARELPVALRGVVTAVGPGSERWLVLQDDTRGIFVRALPISMGNPKVGEVWSIGGVTRLGGFAPVVNAERGSFLGRARLPEPAHPTWNQLINGNLDVQWCEVQGLVTGVASNSLSLLLPEGNLAVNMTTWGQSELTQFTGSVVRIRGTLFAEWSAETHEVRVRQIEMRNASVSVDRPAPEDPFDAPEKSPRGLFLFDAKATPFRRVKIRGQVTFVDSKRIFIELGSAIQIFPAGTVQLHQGDLVEAVGFPEISGNNPVLREALIRRTGTAALPEPLYISNTGFVPEAFNSKRISIEGKLITKHLENDVLVMQIQTAAHLFLGRVTNSSAFNSLQPGSVLTATGIYVSDAVPGIVASPVQRYEVLINSPGEVKVISRPSWWTLQHLVSLVGLLLIILVLAAVWIRLLHGQVSQRTQQLQREIREREHAERQHAVEAERSRIARDLHDDLGSSLTEINVLASTGLRPRSGERTYPALFKAIGDKARDLIAALDVIVWAVDPEDNSLQSLADYLSGYTREYLSVSSIACRFKIPVTLPDMRFDGEIRHELLMVVKETLNNIVRHADATEVEFLINVANGNLEICIADNGKGFDPASDVGGKGIKNRSTRLTNVGGGCQVESRPGEGTVVKIGLPLSAASGGGAQVG